MKKIFNNLHEANCHCDNQNTDGHCLVLREKINQEVIEYRKRVIKRTH